MAPLTQNAVAATTALEWHFEYLRQALTNQSVAFDVLCNVLDVTLVANRPLALGTVLSFLRDSRSITLLREWSEHSPDSELLADLGETLSELNLPTRMSPLANSKPGREHFFGGLDDYYLLALLAERLPSLHEDPHGGMLYLRVWLFMHAYQRHCRGIRLDENIRTIARSLRMGCDNDPGWLKLFLSLSQTRSNRSFRELNFKLGGRAKAALLRSGLKDKERRTLRAICEVAAYRDRQITSPSHLPTLLYSSPTRPPKVESTTVSPESEEGSTTDIRDTDRGTILVTKHVPLGYTPAERKLSTQTVLLASAESMQFLPWSWQRPNPEEIERLGVWVINTLSKAPSASSNALLAAYLWTAVALGRSTTRTLALHIGNSVSEEWQFDKDRGRFIRFPPMRLPGWLPDEAAKRWIEPVADEISIPIPDTVRLALEKAFLRHPVANTFRELWPAGSSNTPEQAISAALQEISPRLAGTMLGEILPSRAFELHHDAVLARLIASHPQTSLSGAHSYAQWRLDTVTSLLSSSHPIQQPSQDARTIALGSRLAVPDHLIREELAKSRKAVEKARKSSDLLAFHNTYTAYVVIALLAATGARPIRSPFQSLGHFDFDADIVFIDDKHFGIAQQTGRAVPLASGIGAFLRKRYLPHLRALANILARTCPETSQSIVSSLQSDCGSKIPLFFFLDGKEKWSEVSPASLFKHAALDWPLPANLFRHRLANRLRATEVDPEVIDGILGHGEWGCETWSYLSFRSWKDDVANLRPALDQTFRCLRFQPLRGLCENSDAEPLSAFDTTCCVERIYGADARQAERRRRYISTVRDAEFTIREFLQDRPLANLTPDELDVLADKLTRTNEGMPIPTGGLRLAPCASN